MSGNEPIIQFKNVTKTYFLYKNDRARFKAIFTNNRGVKKHSAINGINFSVNKGESVGILGVNGAGKSTVLKMITGVTFPTSGEIIVNGKVAALLELTAGFSAEMTGRENIYLKGYILGLRDHEIEDIETRVIEFADLGEYIDQPIRSYSSGMKMRLGFAININISPEILVIDEALSVGDANFKKKCNAKINELIESGVTVLFVSHSAKGIKDICTRAIYLKGGKVAYDGGVEEAFELYETDLNATKSKPKPKAKAKPKAKPVPEKKNTKTEKSKAKEAEKADTKPKA